MPQTATKSEPPSILAIVLFVVYALLLVGIILFKFPFQYELTKSGRELNLIPFAGSFADHRGFGTGDIISNVLIFLPLGVYLSMFRSRWSFPRGLLGPRANRVLTIVALPVTVLALAFFTFLWLHSK